MFFVGDHIGTASVSLDRWHGAWDSLPEVFMTSAMLATSLVSRIVLSSSNVYYYARFQLGILFFAGTVSPLSHQIWR